MDKLKQVYEYHDQTKHHFGHYARSAGYMDWDTKPEAFRHYDGAEVKLFPKSEENPQPTWDQLFGPGLAPTPLTEQSLGCFFYRSMALSAWKEVVAPTGEVVSRWALRVNPSSGNLHPTEAWLANNDGLFHYCPDLHGLEKTAVWEPESWATTTLNLPDHAMIIGLSSIHWREAWKYGERAFRYCQHDVGHTLAALSIAAGTLGWSVAKITDCGTRQMAHFLGLDNQHGPEAEYPDTLFILNPSSLPITATAI